MSLGDPATISAATTRAPGRRWRALLPALVLVAVVHGALLWVAYVPGPRRLVGDEVTYLRAVRQLLETGTTGSDQLWPPLYTHWLAGFLSLSESHVPLVLAQGLLLVVAALVARDICKRLSCPAPVGDVTSLLLLVYPPLAAFAHYLWPEVLHLTLLLIALWILAAHRQRLAWSLLLGLVVGLALLTKNILGPFVPALLAPIALADRWRRGLARAGAAVVVMALVLAPTALSNWQREGRPVISSSGWFNAWVGLTDVGNKTYTGYPVAQRLRTYRQSSPRLVERERIVRGKIVALLKERGVVRVLCDQLGHQYFRLFDKDSFLTDQLPGGAATAIGFGYCGPPSVASRALRYSSYGLYAGVLVGAAFGLSLCPVRRSRWTWLALGFIAYNLAIFLVLHVKTRYQVQFLPMVFVFSGYSVSWVLRRLGLIVVDQGELAAPGRLSVVLSSLLAVLLLFLAFGGVLVS